MLKEEMELHNKQDIIEYLEYTIKELKEHPESLEGQHSVYFYGRIINLLTCFLENIKYRYLPRFTDKRWLYYVEVREYGIKLSIDFVGVIDEDDEFLKDSGCMTEVFYLIDEKCKMLTVEEYANIYNVSVTTVRQWIRRGKLRTAKKYGNEWRIPELSEVIRRGYISTQYKIKGYIEQFDENYSYINSYNLIEIEQDKQDKKKYIITFCNSENNEEKTEIVDLQERERFELLLISNAMIECEDELILGSY